MKTKIISVNTENPKSDQVADAGAIIRAGGLVAFPTETVYGIGANALDPQAVELVYGAKGRPADNPLIVHIADKEEVRLYTSEITPLAYKLMDEFWPGPLTLIFRKNTVIPDRITGGLDTIALRMPSHPVALAVIKEARRPVAAPSANLSGRPSPTEASHVIEDLSGRVEMIIDGGSAGIGLESTVVDVTGDHPVILRPGSITKEMIQPITGTVGIDSYLLSKNAVPRSPGMKYKHYAPKGKLTIVQSTDRAKAIRYIQEQAKHLHTENVKVGIIATEQTKDLFDAGEILTIGSEENLAQIGANLFGVLRKMDELGVHYIYSLEFTSEELGMAIMNRLIKAAGHHVVMLDQK